MTKRALPTNLLEAIRYFSDLLERSIKGSQIHVSDHLQCYINERTFAYNHREATDLGHMEAVTTGARGRRLTWAELVA